MHRIVLLALAGALIAPSPALAAPRWVEPALPFGDVAARQDEAGAVMAADGRIVFARIAPDGALEVRERPAGGPVGAPVTLAADDAEHLRVLMGVDGTAAVLFDEEGERYAARRAPGGPGSDPRPLGAAGGGPAGGRVGAPVPLAGDAAEHLRVLMGVDGTGAVLFDEEGERYAARRAPGGRWSDPRPLGPAGGDAGTEGVTSSGEVWEVAPAADGSLAVHRTSGAPIVLPAPAVGADDTAPVLALPRTGGGHVVYVEEGATGAEGSCTGKTVVHAVDVSAAGAVSPRATLDSFAATGAGTADDCAFDDGELV